jgi:8-oxo-dGTP diphosphatase
VVGLLLRDGEVLIARRQSHQHLAGFWEYPGGKLELDEPVQAGLIRELNEELGIEVLSSSPFTVICHSYADKSVKLDCWLVESFCGEPQGREGQEVRWVTLEALPDYRFPEANHKISQQLREHVTDRIDARTSS